MSLEKEMKKVAAALTGQETDSLPDNLEAICSFIAENYEEGQDGTEFEQVTAPAELSAAPTQEDFNGLVAKLKETKIFK